MEVSNFSDFKEEIEKSEIKKSILEFGNNTFKITTPFDFNDLLDILILLLLSTVFLFSSTLLFVSLLCFLLFWHRLFMNFRGIGILEVDFTAKTIRIKNRVFIINILRNLFGIKSKNMFTAIKEIRFEESSLMDKLGFIQQKTTYLLLIETFQDAPIAASRFVKEEDAKILVRIFEKFLLDKEKIIA